jgi:hypothetical protein
VIQNAQWRVLLSNEMIGVQLTKQPQQTQLIRVSNFEALCIQQGSHQKMHTTRSFFGIACRAAALSFLMAGTASLMHAQQAPTTEPATKAPLFLASSAQPLDLTSSSSSSSSISSADDAAVEHFDLKAAGLDSSQPPPRRRYGRPNYSDSHNNPDGSSKYTFMVGGGLALPVGNTHKYETPSWGFQGGFGRNFNQTVGVLLQFDYDHFGLQGATLANQQFLYNYGCTVALQNQGVCSLITNLDGNNHVWSFTLDPTFTLVTQGSLGAYVVVGGGFYHKVTNFQVPTVGSYCDPYYGCYQYQANQTIDHYTSNAAGVNGGLGLTYKFSKFSNERFYVEARYVLIANQHRPGVTAASSTATLNAYNGFNLYPQNSNRTSYIPIKFGIRF